MVSSEAVGLDPIPVGNNGGENLLLSLPRRQNLILGDVGPCRLPMTGRREPRLVRGQNVWAVLVGRRCRRKQAKQDNAGCSDHGKSG